MEKYTITLTQEQWNLIGDAISNIPYRHVAGLINELNSQFDQQLQDKNSASELEKESE